METQTSSIAGRLVAGPATVNDFLPGDPGSLAGRLYPAIEGPEIEPATVSVSRETLRKLTLGADAFREAWNAAVESEDPSFADLIAQHIDHLTDAGLVSAEDGRTTEAFDLACALGGIALGVDAGGGALPADDGSGVDALAEADNDDDFEADVAAAEQAFLADEDGPSPDPDWPGDPVPPAMDALPRAGSFAGD